MVDSTKKKNRKCENCLYFRLCKCELSGEAKKYWNMCKKFEWNPARILPVGVHNEHKKEKLIKVVDVPINKVEQVKDALGWYKRTIDEGRRTMCYIQASSSIISEAIKVIEKLEAENKQLRKERDAAVKDIESLWHSNSINNSFTRNQIFVANEYYCGLKCMFCKKFKHFNCPLPEDHGDTCWHGNCKFEWRGVQGTAEDD